MYKIPFIPVVCKECGKPHTTIPVYEYNWNDKKQHLIPIQESPKNWSGQEVKQLTNRTWTNYYAIIHKKRTDKYFVEYVNKFSGLLCDGKTKLTIHFDSIICEDCRHKLEEDENSFQSRFTKLFKEEEEKKYNSQHWVAGLSNGSKVGFSGFYPKSGPILNNLGCLWLGYTILGGGSVESLKKLEEAVEKLFKEKLKVKFEFVYSYSESLNPDRDGVYCMVRPISFIGEKDKSKKPKELKEKYQTQRFNLRNLDYDYRGMWAHPQRCIEHRILPFGGLHEETLRFFKAAAISGNLSLVGFETPVPEKDEDLRSNFNWMLVSFLDTARKEKYFVESYLVKETIDEFNKRLKEFMKRALKFVLKLNEYDMRNSNYNISSTVATYLSNYPKIEVNEMLSDFSKDEKDKILENCEKFLEYKREVFSR